MEEGRLEVDVKGRVGTWVDDYGRVTIRVDGPRKRRSLNLGHGIGVSFTEGSDIEPYNIGDLYPNRRDGSTGSEG